MSDEKSGDVPEEVTPTPMATASATPTTTPTISNSNYDNEYLRKFRNNLSWESDSVPTGVAQSMVGCMLAFTFGLLIKFVGFYICIAVIIVEILRRKEVLCLNYDPLYNLLVRPATIALEVLNSLADDPVNRNFIAGMLLGFSASVR